MQTVSQLLGGQAAPHTLEHDGVTYEVHAVTQAVKTEIERAVQAQVRQAILGEPGGTPEGVLAEALRLHSRDVLAGHYSFYGQAVTEYLGTYAGVLHLARVLLRRREGDKARRCTDDEAAGLFLGAGAELSHLVGLAVRESLPPAILRAIEKAEQAQQAQQGQGSAQVDGGPADPNG